MVSLMSAVVAMITFFSVLLMLVPTAKNDVSGSESGSKFCL